ncbi:MAG: FtsW/RodA/SpoVE family cell cycle protein [Prevotella sp.]|jgi:cell division protein FtsW|nr:FtsW/RodA/SpoVE family cell cycle protein [Prevotella sp.]
MTLPNKNVNLGNLFEGDKVLWMVLFFLCIISILEVYSASSNMTFEKGAYWSPVLKHGMYLCLGVGITWVIHRIHCRYFGWIVIIGPILSILLLLAALLSSGSLNDTNRWLSVGGFSFQPSEIAKGSLVVVVAWLLSVMRDEKGATMAAFKWILGVTIIICGLIVKENLSTALFTFIVILMMMIVGNVPWKPLSALIGMLVIAGSIGYSVLAFTPDSTLEQASKLPGMKRLTTWAHRVRNHTEVPADPLEYDLNTNPQITQAHIAVATSGIIGCGPGNSKVRDFLPQAYSDFIFAIILEELGLIGGLFVLMLYITLLYRAARIASRCEKNFPAFLILGLSLLIVTQALINMMVAVGLFPVTGQPLPLVSRGGSSIMVNCAYIGMMLSISRSARQNADLSTSAI